MKKNKPYGDDYVPANDEADMTDVLEDEEKDDEDKDDEDELDEDDDLDTEEDDEEEELE